MSFIFALLTVFFLTRLAVFSRAAGVHRNLTIGLTDPSVTFSSGWSTAVYAGAEFALANELGDAVQVVLPGMCGVVLIQMIEPILMKH